MTEHISVLLKESIEALNIKKDGCYLDGTFGRGGHSKEILANLGENGLLYATDRDPSATKEAEGLVDKRFVFRKGEFSNFMSLFPEIKNGSLDGVLLDLGVSSPQLDVAERGFSFIRDGELDMRMNPENGISAKEFVNKAEYGELVNVIASLGEERFARNIAKKIIKERTQDTILTTKQLAEIVREAVPVRFHVEGRHPATRTFQAIRMFVNKEVEELDMVLKKVYPALKKGGRLVIISFHSGEDKQVKNFVRSLAGDEVPPEIPIMDTSLFEKMKLIGRPIRPTEQEVLDNPRSRSSIMRVVEKK